jgi:uncharacterized protein (TIGR02996 family)
MDMHDAFLRDILAHPDDEGRRLIYADWLQEQGEPQSVARAELLRLEVALARLPDNDEGRTGMASRWAELRAAAGPDWLAALAQVPIENCQRSDPQSRCPQRWDRLGPAPKEWEHFSEARDPSVRWCASCRGLVYYCRSIDDAGKRARRGDRVAVDQGVVRREGDLSAPTFAEPRLLVVRGARPGVEYPIYEGANFIGRADEKPVDIDLEEQEPPDRIWCSRQHACVHFEQNRLFVEDLNSAGGTYLNRNRTYPGQRFPMAPGDVLQIGSVQLRVVE